MGFSITLKKLNLPFYPHKKREYYYAPKNQYDFIYCSIIFETNKNYVVGDNIIFGGTGYDYSISLPEDIDNELCDYSIYKDTKDTQVFLTRGCIRNCYFCFVPKKEGKTYLYRDLDNIIKEYEINKIKYNHNRIRFFDNNILSYKDHKQVFKRLIDLKYKVSFNEGLDFRLLDQENTLLLKKLKQNEYIFAFDDIKYLNMMEKQKELLQTINEYNYKIRFYIYINAKMSVEDTTERIKYCKKNNYLCYVMRDKNVYDSEYSFFYTDLASYCNQVNFYKKLTFEEFLELRSDNATRKKRSLNLYKNGVDVLRQQKLF